MPDLGTHVLATYLASRCHPKGGRWIALLLLGAILPDVLTRPFFELFPDAFWFFFPLHTPLVLVLVCYALSLLFEEQIRAKTFIALYAGVLLHLALDLLQKSATLAYTPLFPFSWATWSAGLFWPDQSLLLIPLLLILSVVVALRSNQSTP